MIKKKKELEKRILSSIILMPIAIFFIFQENIFFVFFLSVLFLISSYEWVKINKNDIIKIIGIFYLFVAFFMAYLLREKFSVEIFILILVICIFTDLGGYIFGKILKGPKLTKISPKKTYTGVIGSFILSLIAALIYIKLIASSATCMQIFYLFYLHRINQVGDLIISYFKRLVNVKTQAVYYQVTVDSR